MRFALLHLSVDHGGVYSFLISLGKGLSQLGHSSFIINKENIARLRDTNYDFILVNSFSEENWDIYEESIGFLDFYQIPYAILLHDYWPICYQTNLINFDRGCEQCKIGQEGQCDPSTCNFNYEDPMLSKDINEISTYKHPLFYRDLINKNVICFTEKSAEIFTRAGLNKITVINHGVDTDKFNIQKELGDNIFKILFTNAWGKKDIKGYKHWNWIKKNMPNISFLETIGETAHDRMNSFYNSGDCLLFLSLWQETFGLVILEAMACGLPVISYPVGIAPEIIDGQNGILVETYNPKDVIDAIEKVKENITTETMEYCRDIVLSKYTLRHMAQKYIDMAIHI